MREPSSNIVNVCSEHSRKMPKTMRQGEELWIKVRFPVNGPRVEGWEHMWVRVSTLLDRAGTLDNQPALADYVKSGDVVSFTGPNSDGYYTYQR